MVRAAAVGLVLLRAADPQAKGAVERLQGYMETELRARPAGRRNDLDFQLQLDAVVQKANARDAQDELRERPSTGCSRSGKK